MFGVSQDLCGQTYTTYEPHLSASVTTSGFYWGVVTSVQLLLGCLEEPQTAPLTEKQLCSGLHAGGNGANPREAESLRVISQCCYDHR